MRWKKLALMLAFLGCFVRKTSAASIDDLSDGIPTAKGFEVGGNVAGDGVAKTFKPRRDSERTTMPRRQVVNRSSDKKKGIDEKGAEDEEQRDGPPEEAQDGDGGDGPMPKGVIILISATLATVITLPLLLFFLCGCVRCRGSSLAASNDATSVEKWADSVSDVTSASRSSGAVRLDVRRSALADSARQRFDQDALV